MKKFLTSAMLLCSIIASAQVYVYNTTSLIGEYETNPDSIITIPPYRTPLPASDEGALSGVFSVSQTRKVRFSKGNLQYLTASRTWQFAAHQYDTVGSNIANAAIDQFGLGTSGWNGSNAAAYYPIDTIMDEQAYIGYIGGYADYSLTGYMEKRDWGIYNAISNGGDKAGLWRTPTNKEWSYMLTNRWTPYAIAIVNNIWGIVILPDGWNEEPTLKLRPSYYDKDCKQNTSLTEAEIKAILELCNNDTLSYDARTGGYATVANGRGLDIAFYRFIPGYDYTIEEGGNVSATWAERPLEDYSISPDEWQAYEAKGCVFLPFEKSRSHPINKEKWMNSGDPVLQDLQYFNYVCMYWAASSNMCFSMTFDYTRNNSNNPYRFNSVTNVSYYCPYAGGCVRLIQDY